MVVTTGCAIGIRWVDTKNFLALNVSRTVVLVIDCFLVSAMGVARVLPVSCRAAGGMK